MEAKANDGNNQKEQKIIPKVFNLILLFIKVQNLLNKYFIHFNIL